MKEPKQIIADIMDRLVDRPGHNMLASEIIKTLNACGYCIAPFADSVRADAAPLSDLAYREKLIRSGVRLDLIVKLAPHELDNVGNIVGVYRTDMKTQDPAGYKILQEKHQTEVEQDQAIAFVDHEMLTEGSELRAIRLRWLRDYLCRKTTRPRPPA